MKFMCSAPRCSRLLFSFFLIALLSVAGVDAQSKAKKGTPAKKAETHAKSADKSTAKTSKTQASKKSTKSEPRKESASAKSKDTRGKASAKQTTAKTAKNERLSAKETAKAEKGKKDSKKTVRSKAEERRLAAERRAEEKRRQEIIAERRRREQAARERRLAFERGLRNETIQNIAADVTDGEDLNVRRAAVDALGSRAGTVVVMEAQTGKVLTIVNQDWAIKHSFKPCSTIKLVTGVAGLNERVIETGSEDLEAALARSKNPYFQKVGSNFGSRKMVEYAHELGLGELTGINAEGETAGRVPNGNNNARIYSHGDDFEVTPLQLAVMVSALSNGGKRVVPQIPRKRIEKTSIKTVVKDTISLPANSYEGVLPGMVGAAEYGTAHRGVDAGMGVAGKTGSCIFAGSWIGLFASVAPVEDPKYSVVVITRGEGERGKYAAAVAGKVYQALAGQIRRNPDRDLAKRFTKRNSAGSNVADAADDDEDDTDSPEINADDELTPAATSRKGSTVAAAPAPADKKLVQKTTQSKPSNFKPVVITYDREKAAKEKNSQRPRVVKNK